MKKTLIKTLIVLAVCSVAFLSGKYISHLRSENERLSNNSTALLEENGELKTEKKALELGTKELNVLLEANKTYSEMLKSELGIKEGRIKNLTFQISKMKIDTVTLVKDSTIYVDSNKVVTAKYAEFKTPYVEASVLIADTSAKWHVSSIDTIAVVVHDKANFFQRLFGKHKITGSITNRNPYSEIYLDKVIIKK